MRIAVVGTGLIGASAGLAALRAGLGEVVGWDEDPEALEVAAGRAAVEPAESLEDALLGADVALVAVSVAGLPTVVREVLRASSSPAFSQRARRPSSSPRPHATAPSCCSSSSARASSSLRVVYLSGRRSDSSSVRSRGCLATSPWPHRSWSLPRCSPESELVIRGVHLNPRRTGLLTILERMGASVAVSGVRDVCGEPACDLLVKHAPLSATDVDAEEVPVAIDELPLFALAAAGASGESVVRGAGELRAKESDRIGAVVTGLCALGVDIDATSDGFRVRGRPERPPGGAMESVGDHRVAMLAAIAGLASKDGVEIGGSDAVAVSFHGFFDALEALAAR